MSEGAGRGGAFGVLFVCTGNICRSPLAEGLSRVYLAEAGPAAAGAVHVESAGTRAVVGDGMHPLSAQLLERLGGDPAGFVARQLTDAMIASADLVLTMTRDHRAEVLGRNPRGMARTFTLREAADLLGRIDGALPGVSPSDRARALVQAMAGQRSRRRSGGEDDIADPIGGPAEVHAETARAVADSLRPLLDALVDALSAGVPAVRRTTGTPLS
jgi:protein-tyrosine phosphatase